MSQYMWNPQALGQVFMMPAAAVDALALATPEQLRVLMWFSRYGQDFDLTACADALGLTPAECEGCLQFWAQQGVLNAVGAPAAPAPAPAPKKPTAPVAAVKPLWKEVVAYQREHREFTVFLQEVSARLGRTVTHGDESTLMYLVTTAGIPMPSILMAVGYAVSLGKDNVRYIEKMALSWADEDIVTPEQVDRKITELQKIRQAADKVEELLSLPRHLTAAQAKMAYTWLTEWQFTDEMLQHAYTITMDNCDKFSPAYMNKILERWNAEGILTPDRIVTATPKKKGPASTNPEQSSLVSQELEDQLLKYRPKFNKKT